MKTRSGASYNAGQGRLPPVRDVTVGRKKNKGGAKSKKGGAKSKGHQGKTKKKGNKTPSAAQAMRTLRGFGRPMFVPSFSRKKSEAKGYTHFGGYPVASAECDAEWPVCRFCAKPMASVLTIAPSEVDASFRRVGDPVINLFVCQNETGKCPVTEKGCSAIMVCPTEGDVIDEWKPAKTPRNRRVSKPLPYLGVTRWHRQRTNEMPHEEEYEVRGLDEDQMKAMKPKYAGLARPKPQAKAGGWVYWVRSVCVCVCVSPCAGTHTVLAPGQFSRV